MPSHLPINRGQIQNPSHLASSRVHSLPDPRLVRWLRESGLKPLTGHAPPRLTEDERQIVAFHEAGHVLEALFHGYFIKGASIAPELGTWWSAQPTECYRVVGLTFDAYQPGSASKVAAMLRRGQEMISRLSDLSGGVVPMDAFLKAVADEARA